MEKLVLFSTGFDIICSITGNCAHKKIYCAYPGDSGAFCYLIFNVFIELVPLNSFASLSRSSKAVSELKQFILL